MNYSYIISEETGESKTNYSRSHHWSGIQELEVSKWFVLGNDRKGDLCSPERGEISEKKKDVISGAPSHRSSACLLI